MTTEFATAMGRATQATRGRSLSDATRIIQDALGAAGLMPRPADGDDGRDGPLDAAGTPARAPGGEPPARRPRRPLGEVIERLSEAGRRAGVRPGSSGPGAATSRTGRPVPLPRGAAFEARSFAGAAGARGYRLYVPAAVAQSGQAARGLVVMLHGCQQDPEDFALGTGMNARAEEQGLLVAYPGQSQSANGSSCWNWFRPEDQGRGGEPAILAGIAAALVAEFGLERDGVFAAGLSAGGAMAAVLAETYPELFAAVGIHSGLAYRSASDVVSAFAAMRGEGPVFAGRNARERNGQPPVRHIVFHGDADRTVNAVNAERIVAAARSRLDGTTERERGGQAGGRAYRRRIAARPDGTPMLESWLIEGAGHAWSGGSPEGSFTDPAGPDASAEMLRFFLQSS